jgi:Bax protein
MLVNASDYSCEGIADPFRTMQWTAQLSPRRAQPIEHLDLDESELLLRHFQGIGYDLKDVRTDLQPVPRVYLAKMPTDLTDIDESRTRKQVFLSALLPAILQVNEEIREVRRRLTAVAACQHAGLALPWPVEDWLAQLAKHYRTEPDPDILLIKVAEIPPSMALAQAAVESGWGTSAPAQNGNSLFGQYMVEEVTKGRTKKTNYRLASFETVQDAVRAYADNLNSHPAYAQFRAQRTQMLKMGLSLDGIKLAGTLLAYSKRGQSYVRDVQTMIRRNRLDALDRVDLAARNDILMN